MAGTGEPGVRAVSIEIASRACQAAQECFVGLRAATVGEEGAVLDAVGAGVQSALDTDRGMTMRSDRQAVAVRRVDDDAQLINAELRLPHRECRGVEAAGCHHLDDIAAALDAISDRPCECIASEVAFAT